MYQYLLSIFFLATISCESAETSKTGISDSVVAASNSDSATSPVMSGAANADTTSLKGSWYLMAVLPSDTAAGKIPEINFDLTAKRFTGNTGCNRMSGNFQQSDSSLVFDSKLMSTKMACTGYNEEAFIKNLLRTNRFRFSEGMLILMADGVEISKWTRKPERGPRVQKA